MSFHGAGLLGKKSQVFFGVALALAVASGKLGKRGLTLVSKNGKRWSGLAKTNEGLSEVLVELLNAPPVREKKVETPQEVAPVEEYPDLDEG